MFSFKPHHVRQHIALPTDVSRESYVCVCVCECVCLCVCVCVLIGYSVSINCYAVWRFSAVSRDANLCVCSGKNGVSELRPHYLWYIYTDSSVVDLCVCVPMWYDCVDLVAPMLLSLKAVYQFQV